MKFGDTVSTNSILGRRALDKVTQLFVMRFLAKMLTNFLQKDVAHYL